MNITRVSSGYGVVMTPQGTPGMVFAADGKVEPQLLERFEASSRCEGLESPKLRRFAETVEAFNNVGALDGRQKQTAMLGSAKEALGDQWQLGSTGFTDRDCEYFSAYLPGQKEGDFQVVMVDVKQHKLSVETITPELVHTVRSDAEWKLADESAYLR